MLNAISKTLTQYIPNHIMVGYFNCCISLLSELQTNFRGELFEAGF